MKRLLLALLIAAPSLAAAQPPVLLAMRTPSRLQRRARAAQPTRIQNAEPAMQPTPADQAASYNFLYLQAAPPATPSPVTPSSVAPRTPRPQRLRPLPAAPWAPRL